MSARQEPAVGETLGAALRDIVRRPVTNLLTGWNWKAALISVCIRATVFFATNLRAGHASALRASLVEAGFAIVAAGVLAAITQRIRHAQPVWATGIAVWLGVPALLLTVQSTVHHLAGTPHMKTGLIASFVMAAFGSGFNWYAQRRGLLITGAESAGGDWKLLPRVVLDFVLAGPRALLKQ
ncbi:hypothetical protein [Granulicella paludicola]|jgi:hypothetical protein|uniref:hypothetical protein n=1 Tax=Granulicella paludicola TaxID=474951 RepID=UPI0021E06334|nr:hypothetical protein [Granulicella paludicola]